MNSTEKVPKKNQESRKRRKLKRQASSPLQDSEHGENVNTNNCKHSGPTSIPLDNNSNSVYTNSAVSDLTSSFVYPYPYFQNMSLQNPFGFSQQFMQSPPPAHISPMPTVAPPVYQQSAPPAWASQLLEEMKEIKDKVSKIDQISKTLGEIKGKMSELESTLKEVEKRTHDTEQSCKFLSDVSDNHTQELERAKSDIKTVKKSCQSIETRVKDMENISEKMESKIVDLQRRSMNENLMFYGVPEQEGEKCEELLKQEILIKTLQIPTEKAMGIKIDRVHRVGQKNTGTKPRPIVAKFHDYQDREYVRRLSIEKREDLKRVNLGIGIQWPQETREKRRQLIPIMRRLQQEGKQTKLVNDKLFVNGREYKLNTGGAEGNNQMEH